VKIAVRLFADLADRFPSASRGQGVTLDVPEDATVADLMRRLALPDGLPRLTLVNGRDATEDQRLRPGDVVSIIPPLAGG
jgi:molybdopterin converting factor small subunit